MGCCCCLSAAVADETVADVPTSSPEQQKQFDSPCLGLEEEYDFTRELGRGGTGRTYLAEDRKTKELVAIKLIKRPIPKVLEQEILREVVIQANLGEGHGNIINAFEAVLTETHLAVIMEYAAGGTLTSYVANRWKVAEQTGLFLFEDEARYIMRQYVSALEYGHKHNVAHRDLKLDNTLVTDSTLPMIKLCDFGFGKMWAPLPNWEEVNSHRVRGPPVYKPQELMYRPNKGDGKLVDVWACGVLLTVMLLGTFPFDTCNPYPNSDELYLQTWMNQVKSGWREVSAIKPRLVKLSDGVKKLLDKIFQLNEKERITIEGIKEDPWYQEPLPPKFAKAETRITEQQHKVEELCRERRLNPNLREKRIGALAALVGAGTYKDVEVDEETGKPNKQKILQRVDLREQSVFVPLGGPDSAADC